MPSPGCFPAARAAAAYDTVVLAYLQACGASIDRTFDRPDFLASWEGVTIALEATTANPSGDPRADISIRQLVRLREAEVFDKVSNDFPIRMANILRRKLRLGYGKLPHCAGKPLVLAVSPLFEPGAPAYTDDALAGYLYGLTEEHQYRGRGVRSGFFLQPGARQVSAVLFSNQFSVSRFFRLAGEPASGHTADTLLRGYCYVTMEDSSAERARYEYQVGDPRSTPETWWQGVTLLLNPFADIPLPKDCLRSSSVIYVDEEGSLIREIDGFHPVTSLMSVHIRG